MFVYWINKDYGKILKKGLFIYESRDNMASNQTFNQYVVKKENKSLVLQLIKSSSPISRASIAQQTGLNKSTVSSLVSELLEKNLVYEAGAGKSSGGRKPVMLFFNELAGFTIGIDLGVNYLLGVLTDLSGNIVKEEKININLHTYKDMEAKLFKLIDGLTTNAPISIYGIVGIGLGIPGAINKNGEILSAPNLGWEELDLKTTLEKKYNLPVSLENEAKAGAYGEKQLGAGKECLNMVYISIGIGIGSGLILDGNLYQGSNGFAGETGHMTIKADGTKCRCGNIGCWELYASEKSLLNKATKLRPTASTEEITLESLMERAEKEDKEVIPLFEEIGNYIGIGINNIINTFNPEQIIIGNRLSAAKKWIENPIENRLNETNLSFQQGDTKIVFSHLNTHSAAIGMAAFAIEKFLQLN